MDKYINSETGINRLLEPFGLLLIGSLKLAQEDRIPDITDGLPARHLLLVGNGGSSFWPVFSQSPEFQDGLADSLDRWSRRVGDALADETGGRSISWL
jgi:epoxyqueuosine reductase